MTTGLLGLHRREIVRCIKLMKQPRSIFVFGSNLAGVHGAGAARTAYELFGAVLGQGRGYAGQSYALPTKNRWLESLPLDQIKGEVEEFLVTVGNRPDHTFVVTRIGCGLAGYKDEDIAPFFKGAPGNCELPEGWRDYRADSEAGINDSRKNRDGEEYTGR